MQSVEKTSIKIFLEFYKIFVYFYPFMDILGPLTPRNFWGVEKWPKHIQNNALSRNYVFKYF